MERVRLEVLAARPYVRLCQMVGFAGCRVWGAWPLVGCVAGQLALEPEWEGL